MQFFTAAWASGDVDDAEAGALVQRYNDHLSKFDQSGEVFRFATTVGLNDAYLDRLMVDTATGLVQLLLLTGDLQVGYWRTTLSYRSARIADGQPLLLGRVSARPTEIWYDEFTSTAEGMSHAFLLAPIKGAWQSPGEFRIDFKEFSFSQIRANERELATPEDQSVWS